MPKSRTRRVTSADVARQAGVSRATVSYVLNAAPGQTISAETRERVLHVAAMLGYAPSAAARTLRLISVVVAVCSSTAPAMDDW